MAALLLPCLAGSSLFLWTLFHLSLDCTFLPCFISSHVPMRSSLCCQHVESPVISLTQKTLTVPFILWGLNAIALPDLTDGGSGGQTDQYWNPLQLFWARIAELWGTKAHNCCMNEYFLGKKKRWGKGEHILLPEQPRLLELVVGNPTPDLSSHHCR